MRTAKILVRLGNVFAGHTGNCINLVMLRLKFQRQEGSFSNKNHVQIVITIMYKKFLISREQNAKMKLIWEILEGIYLYIFCM